MTASSLLGWLAFLVVVAGVAPVFCTVLARDFGRKLERHTTRRDREVA